MGDLAGLEEGVRINLAVVGDSIVKALEQDLAGEGLEQEHFSHANLRVLEGLPLGGGVDDGPLGRDVLKRLSEGLSRFDVVADVEEVGGEGGGPAIAVEFHGAEAEALVEGDVPLHQADEAVIGGLVIEADRVEG